ncbi:MAG: phage holin family protein [Parerythrobacter sp.]
MLDAHNEEMHPQDANADALVNNATKTERSLADDIAAFFSDAKTYAEAEFAFQNSRARFAASHGLRGLVFAVVALVLLNLLLIALAVGSIVALAPVIGGWVATGIVCTVILAGLLVTGFLARSRIRRVQMVFAGDEL